MPKSLVDQYISRSQQKAIRSGFNHLQNGLRFVSGLVDKIPSKDDTKFQTITKCAGIAGSLLSLVPHRKSSDASIYAEKIGVGDQAAFFMLGALIMQTTGTSGFELTDLEDEVEKGFVLGTHPKHGTVLFREAGTRGFWMHTPPSLDQESLTDEIWGNFDNCIQLSDPGGETLKYSKFSPIPHPMFGSDQGKLDQLVARHRRIKAQERSVAYMFYGPAGTGKTSFTHMFGQRIGGRILRLDLSRRHIAYCSTVLKFVNEMRPDLIIADEFDKISTSETAGLLEFFQELRQSHNVSLVLTGNKVSHFDPGLLRPGRINMWVEFGLAGSDERREILASYMAQHKTVVSPGELEDLVAVTEGLSNDYLRDATERLCYMDFADVVADLRQMRSMLHLPDLQTGATLRIIESPATADAGAE